MAASPDEGAASALPAEVASVATGALKVAVDSQDLAPNARWSLSGAKPGNGAPQLMDGDLETFWQSDGTAPHTVTLRFDVRTSMSELAFYVDHGLDESYTPQEVIVKHGLQRTALSTLHTVTLNKPSGWVRVKLGNPEAEGQNAFLRTFVLQLAVTKLHQNGRDTRLRQVKVLGPRMSAEGTLAHSGGGAATADKLSGTMFTIR